MAKAGVHMRECPSIGHLSEQSCVATDLEMAPIDKVLTVHS